jgi:hypothetical protein
VTGIRYAAALVLLALAGCGGHGGGNAAASPSANEHDMAVKFAQCMRQHGVQVDDPQPGQPGIRIRSKLSQSATDAAMQACRKYSPRGDINPNDPKVRDQMLKVAQCLRQHGVQVADPAPGKGLRIQLKHPDAKTQQAVEACNKFAPQPGSSHSSQKSGG